MAKTFYTPAKVTFSLERRTTMVIKLSSSSTDALLVAEHSNVPIHLQAGDPLDIAGVVARRDYTFLLVDWGICRPLINNLRSAPRGAIEG